MTPVDWWDGVLIVWAMALGLSSFALAGDPMAWVARFAALSMLAAAAVLLATP